MNGGRSEYYSDAPMPLILSLPIRLPDTLLSRFFEVIGDSE